MHLNIARQLRDTLTSLRKDCRGIAYVEFALALPLLLMLFMGSVEFTRCLIITQKVEKAAITMSDLVAQTESVTTTQLDNLMLSVRQLMEPFTFADQGYVIVSSIRKTAGNNPTVTWQYAGGGAWTQSSQIGTSGNAAALPAGFTMDDGENVIIAEVYYNFSPMLGTQILNNMRMYRFAVFRPRLGDATTLS
jgi:Flp pilus assembly protein TadG